MKGKSHDTVQPTLVRALVSTPEGREKYYKGSLNLPQTDFPMMSPKAEERVRRETEIISRWNTENLYDQIREAKKHSTEVFRPKFTLHDGPPDGSKMTGTSLSSAAQLMIRLHELNHEGKGDSPETSEIIGQLEMLWRDLDKHERERLDGLSADLYLLIGDEMLVPISDGLTADGVRERLSTAFADRKFDEVLELLRIGPPRLPEADVAYARSRCYEEFRMPAAALAFMGHALSLVPENEVAG